MRSACDVASHDLHLFFSIISSSSVVALLQNIYNSLFVLLTIALSCSFSACFYLMLIVGCFIVIFLVARIVVSVVFRCFQVNTNSRFHFIPHPYVPVFPFHSSFLESHFLSFLSILSHPTPHSHANSSHICTLNLMRSSDRDPFVFFFVIPMFLFSLFGGHNLLTSRREPEQNSPHLVAAGSLCR